MIRAAKRRDARVIAVDQNRNSPGAELADRFLCMSLRDHDAIAEGVAREPLTGIVARVTDQAALDSAQRLAQIRGLPGPEPSLLRCATSKRALAEVCEAEGLPTPRRLSLDRGVDFSRHDVIVRPEVTLRGKAGIRRVHESATLAVAIAEAERASGNGRVEVAEWIPGADISILARLNAGEATVLALWDEWVATLPDGSIAGLGVSMPSSFDVDRPEIRRCLSLVAKTFKNSQAIIILSLRINDAGEAFIIEIHLGLGGDDIADHLLPTALPGFDPFDALLEISAAPPPRAARSPRPCAMIRSSANAWRCVTAKSAMELHQLVAANAPHDWHLPAALSNSRPRLSKRDLGPPTTPPASSANLQRKTAPPF